MNRERSTADGCSLLEIMANFPGKVEREEKREGAFGESAGGPAWQFKVSLASPQHSHPRQEITSLTRRTGD